jgi:multicomponent Na+:H+ antiporter subunit A
MLSAVTLAGGIGVYAARTPLLKVVSRWDRVAHWGPAGWYECALSGLNALARIQTQLLQSGYLRYYLMITMGATLGLVGYALIGRQTFAATLNWTDLRFYEAGLAALIVLAVLAAVLVKARLAAIAALGVVGYCVALVFVLFGAPDLAMTQFLIETLTVILFVLVFYHLPEPRTVSGTVARLRDATLAAAAGALMTALVLVGTPENFQPISTYFEEHSVADGHGRNIVNVILVDFRALDTLGEINVLTVAAVGVYALLKLRPRAERAGESPGIQEPATAGDDSLYEPVVKTQLGKESFATSFILRSTTRLLLPLLLLFSVFLLFRGHNEPGGGFSAALVAASAFVLYRFAFGVQATRRVFPLSPLMLSGAGLLLAAGSGAIALLAGDPLMTGLWGRMAAPGFDDLYVGTPLLFDIGVYATVLGVALSIILPLAEE